jgi:hypothetical protein
MNEILETHEINVRAPHAGPHLDEAGLDSLALRFGEHRFIGIKKSKLIPMQLHGSEADALAKGFLPEGQLRGMFDDKDANGDRLPNTCCALRMADYLGIRSMPELQPLFTELLRVDSTDTAKSGTCLSNLMKDGVNNMPLSKHGEIFLWIQQGLLAIIDYLLKPVDCQDYIRPTAVFEKMVTDGDIHDPQTISKMRDQLGKSEKNIETSCIELSFAARAMKATGTPDEDVKEWLFTGLSQMSQRQSAYYSALEEVASVGKPFEIQVGPEHVRGVIATTDNTMAAKASRHKHLRYAICITRRTDGSMGIFPNRCNKLDMAPIRALIRLFEASVEDRAIADYDQYAAANDLPTAPNWHIMDGGVMLNGSSFIKMKPTKLKDQTLIVILQQGLSGNGRDWFLQLVKQARIVTGMEPAPIVEKPQPHVVRKQSNFGAAPIIIAGSTALGLQGEKDVADALDGV